MTNERFKLRGWESIPSVIKDLTLDEKLNLVGAYMACDTLAIPDMDIPSIRLMDGATGVNGTAPAYNYTTAPEGQERNGRDLKYRTAEFSRLNVMDLNEARKQFADDGDIMGFIGMLEEMRPDNKQFISFPSGVNIGAAFDRKTAYEVGIAIGRELRDSKVDVCLGPNVDIARDPLGGRNYEMYGEDPHLVGEMAVSVITGMQSAGIAACAKHFIANNQETNRNTKDTHLSKRTMMEIYGRGFMRSVREAKVKSIMSAYNAVNGTFTSYSRELLTGLLREEWGFDGVVCSDWGACADDKEIALDAGMGLILCGPNDMSGCKRAILEGRLSEEILNERVGKLLELIVSLQEERRLIPERYNQKELLEVCRRTVTEGAVLLKNEGGVLPLDKSSKIAFYGKRSKEFLECGTGSTNVITGLHSNVLEEARKKIGAENTAFEDMDGADTVVYTVTAPAGENADRQCMDIEEEDRGKLRDVLKEAKEKGKNTVVILNVSGPVDMRGWEEYADSILVIFIPGCMGGVAAADMLFGDAYPAGKLPITFPVRYEDSPSYPNFPGEHNDVYYGEGVFVGYRNYEKRDVAVQYPFGFGQSYTDFEASLISCTERIDGDRGENAVVRVRVGNIGKREGKEVIQAYCAEENPRVLRPVKELAGFEKVVLKPGEEKVVEIKIAPDSLKYYDQEKDQWVLPIGRINVWIGTSSVDIFARTAFTVSGENVYKLGAQTTIEELLGNPQAVAIMDEAANGIVSNIPKEHIPLMAKMTVADLLGMLIRTIPDSAKVEEIRQSVYAKLGQLP